MVWSSLQSIPSSQWMIFILMLAWKSTVKSEMATSNWVPIPFILFLSNIVPTTSFIQLFEDSCSLFVILGSRTSNKRKFGEVDNSVNNVLSIRVVEVFFHWRREVKPSRVNDIQGYHPLCQCETFATEKQVLKSGPKSESFENACYIRNDNSSQFRKYIIEIQFTQSVQLSTAQIDIYVYSSKGSTDPSIWK